jgi:hypothetical protein
MALSRFKKFFLAGGFLGDPFPVYYIYSGALG